MSLWLAALLGAIGVWAVGLIVALIAWLSENHPGVLAILWITGLGALFGALVAFGVS